MYAAAIACSIGVISVFGVSIVNSAGYPPAPPLLYPYPMYPPSFAVLVLGWVTYPPLK